MSAHLKSYAKLNLTLDIKGAEGGYHILDSIVTTIDLSDTIHLKKRKDSLVTVAMHGRGSESLPYESNNAVIAAQRYIDKFGCHGVDITIYKNIPVGAGLGGSSADAAGVLRGMSKLYGFGSERELKELADSLGSDSGYLLTGGFARLHGRGDIIEKLEYHHRLHFLVLVPPQGVSTPECYSMYDKLSVQPANTTQAAVGALESNDIHALGRAMNNDLYAPAALINPDVRTACEELLEFSPLGVTVTGAGSAVFALFENAEFCTWAQSRYRGKFECIHVKSVKF